MIGGERKRKRKKVNNDVSSESDGAADSDSDHEWCDDTDYLTFLNEFLKDPPQTNNSVSDINDDDEADPEYNPEEDDHDSEELRRDPAVKISKKELSELLSEVFDESYEYVKKQDQAVQAFDDDASNSCQLIEQRQEEVEPPLFNNRVVGIIQYQVQQHIQLLCQTYVLTATCSDESMKKLAKESKAMIVELNDAATSHGPKSIFSVKNMSHSKDLINSWPTSVTKSPIKKKILEERYMNENKDGEDGKLFPRSIVKAICESPVFMYSELLPGSSNLGSDYKVNFTVNEDALIVIGLHEMDNDKKYESLKLQDKAQLIKSFLLPGRPTNQIFHRIKNARKAGIKEDSTINCNLKKYLDKKILPPSPIASWTPDLLELEATPPSQHSNLSPTWCTLVTTLRDEVTFKDYFKISSRNEEMEKPLNKKSKKSVTEQSGKKRKIPKSKSVKMKKGLSENLPNESLNKVSPPECKRQKYEFTGTERIPILNMQGEPAAYVLIPKYYSPSKDKTVSNQIENKNNNSKTPLTSYIPNKLCIQDNDKIVVQIEKESFSMPSLDAHSLDSPLKRNIPQKSTASSSALNTSLLPLHERKNREDHSARTWIYQRKSLAEIAQSIDKRLENNEPSETDCPSHQSDHSDVEETGQSHDITEAPIHESNSDHTNPDPSSQNFERPLSLRPITSPIKHDNDENNRSLSDTSSTDHDTINEEPKDKGDSNGGTSQQQKTTSGSEGKSGKDTGQQSGSDGSKSDKRTDSGQAGSSDGRGDGNEEDNPDRRRKRIHPIRLKDDDTDHKEEDDSDKPDDSPPRPSTASSSKPTTKSERKTETPTSKKARKTKGSPGSNAKKRTTKYNTTEMQKLLDDADPEVDIEQIQTAFAEEFWLKLQHTVDPVLYHNIVQIFVDFGDKRGPEDELFAKVGDVLKDFPELLLDFVSMIEPESLETYNFFRDNFFKDNFQCQVQIRFLYLLEKLTVKCPQLKARVLQKLRSLREMDKLKESDVMEVIELYFQGNSVMTDAFKELFPTIFRPETNVRSEDFEEINLDDDTLQKSEEGTAAEVVNFPEESNIPATNTCSCECHFDTRNVSYSTRAKHCRKCCIKFQDGKVFMHSGRMMKQVNIDFVTKDKIVEKSQCNGDTK